MDGNCCCPTAAVPVRVGVNVGGSKLDCLCCGRRFVPPPVTPPNGFCGKPDPEFCTGVTPAGRRLPPNVGETDCGEAPRGGGVAVGIVGGPPIRSIGDCGGGGAG